MTEADTKKPKDEMLFGVAPCMAALQAGKRKIFEVYLGERAMNLERYRYSRL